MALIVEYHVLADMYPVGTESISAGMVVSLNAAGNIVPTPTGNNQTTALGVAGDSALTAEGQTTAYSAQVTLGAGGGFQGGVAGTRFTENRVSDFYDETSASQKITVYHGGGKFWVSADLLDGDGAAFAINGLVGRSATTAGEWLTGAAVGEEVGICVAGAQAYPSGVPGTDVQGSITLGDYAAIVLRI